MITKTKSQLKRKTQAVDELLDILSTQKHLTKKLLQSTASKYNLTVPQLELAYQNKTNFNSIDLRVAKRASKKYAEKLNAIANNDKYKAKAKEFGKFKFKDLTTYEVGNLIHEFLFAYDKRVSDFLIEKKINNTQWYSWLKELKISGTLLGRKVFDYKKYAKVDVITLCKYIRYKNKYNNANFVKLKNYKWQKKINKSNILIYSRLCKVLDAYL